MAEKTDPRTALYTRQQIAALTGLDDSTLNYWMREGVLRPVSGGGGKGQHRQFAFPEINLALMFKELRKFGASVPALRELSDRFHIALDYINGLGVNPRTDERLFDLFRVRDEVERKGHYQLRLLRNELERNIEVMPWVADLTVKEAGRTSLALHLTLEQGITYLKNAHHIYRRPVEDHEKITDEIVDLVMSVDLPTYYLNKRYWEAATKFELRGNSEEFSTDLLYFQIDGDGSWILRSSNMDWERTSTSYVAVDLEQMSSTMWADYAELAD